MIKWNKEIVWPHKSDYILRVLEETFAPSKAGNPTVTLKFEVAYPETVEGPDGPMTVAGTMLNARYALSSPGTAKSTPEQATEFLRGKFIELLKGFEMSTGDINWDNPTLGFKGKLVYAELDDKAEPRRGSPTKEDLAKGIKVGAVLLHPKTKKSLVDHYPEAKAFYGIAELPNANSL